MEIVLSNVTKKIKNHTILSDINLKFTSGKIYGIKGKNGSGKTMLMRAMCGLINLNEGTITIDGEVLGKDISFPRSVGVLIENPSFLVSYSGFKNLKLLASIQNKIDDEQIIHTLEMVGLDPYDKRAYRKYSLGMKQKLGIAAAIMENPDMIILDEPLNALDEESVKIVHDILRELCSKGALIILACHDTEELELLSDEIIEISAGKINCLK